MKKITYTNQPIKWSLKCNRKKGIAKSTWKRELQNELITEINKTPIEALIVAASEEKWKDIVRGLRSNGKDNAEIRSMISMLLK